MTVPASSPAISIDRRRYWQILWFFGRVISHLIWWDLLLGRLFFVRGLVRRSRPDRFRRLSRRFRDLAVDMGGVMIKLGQFLSARVDVLPPEVTEELAGLQDEVPPVAWNDILAVLTQELGDISLHFSHFEAEPLAAASLGQAHQAWLIEHTATDDEGFELPVVVKVQRPGIVDIVQTDLTALRVIAGWAMRYGPIRRRADVPALMDEFAETMWEELDYVSEADNAERFGEMFARVDEVVIPSVHREHSTRRVLVLEDVSGIKITDFSAIEEVGIDPKAVAQRLMDTYFRQIFKEGFFHADPHPGNLFVHPQEYRPGGSQAGGRPFRLAFVDFGMVGRIEELMGDNLRRVLVSITRRDSRGLTEAYDDLGFFLPGSDLERIAEAQEAVLDHIWGRNLLELSQPDPQVIQELGKEFRDLLFDFPFQVPQDFIFLGRAIGMLSGLASLLDPTINPWRLIEQYGREIIKSQEVRQAGWQAVQEWLTLIMTLPMRADRVLAAAEEGRLKIQTVADRQTQRRLERLEKRNNIGGWAIIASAAFIAGAILYSGGETPMAVVSWAIGMLLLFLTLIGRN